MKTSENKLLSRRAMLQQTAGGLVGLSALPQLGRAADSITEKSKAFVPIRAITQGPKFHWFGYYDKLQFDPTNRFVLSNQVDFEHRSPTENDVIQVGMIDLENNDTWTELGTSRAWGWQQGCMLQWRPQSKEEVVWNDSDGKRFVSHVLNVKTKQKRTLSRPIYALSPDGRWGISADFGRIQNMRPGYGYPGVSDPYADQKAPKDSGIWRVDLETGKSELIVSLANVVKIDYQGKSLEPFWHYFNHLLVSPDGERFIFLHRWRKAPVDPKTRRGGGFTTRMFTANADGSGLYVLDPSGNTSHFIWRDPQHICAWTRPNGKPSGFYLFKDQTQEVTAVGTGVMTQNGHNTYLPIQQNAWILNDTYPNSQRQQTPYLYHVPAQQRTDLGHFYSPKQYSGQWRCDTHPRSSNNGQFVTIDSPHGGNGRQVWLLDIRELVS